MNKLYTILILVLLRSIVYADEPIDLNFQYSSYAYATWSSEIQKYGNPYYEKTPGTITLKVYGESHLASFTFDNKNIKLYDINIDKDTNDDGDSVLVISDNPLSYCIIIGPSYINLVKIKKFKYSFSIKISNNTNTSNGLTSGSGFAINRHYMVTNNHVVKDSKYFAVSNDPASRRFETFYPARVVYQDRDIDIAVLYVDSTLNPCQLDRNIYTIGDNVYVYGYPQIMKQGLELKMTSGIISSKRGYMDDIKTYQMDASVQPGNSGGPVIKQNKVIGVTNSYLVNSQNVNYAIKSIFVGIILDLLSIKNEGPFSKPTECTYLILGSNEE